jgi:Zn-dependent M28 family amino/carboxypeptidase
MRLFFPKYIDLEERLYRIVDNLGREERNLINNPSGLVRAGHFIEDYWNQLGLKVKRQTYSAGSAECFNIEAVSNSFSGNQSPHLIIGAHYDSALGTPGADDNLSALAILLESSRLLSEGESGLEKVRFVAFTNEEPPHFLNDTMGSCVHARACATLGDNVRGMLCLESLGYYSHKPGSQELPEGFEELIRGSRNRTFEVDTTIGNFLALVGDDKSVDFLDAFYTAFAPSFPIPTIPVIAPEMRMSDQFPYWDVGIPALMLTDTALFRNPNYHRASDLPETLDYTAMAFITKRLTASISLLNTKI